MGSPVCPCYNVGMNKTQDNMEAALFRWVAANPDKLKPELSESGRTVQDNHQRAAAAFLREFDVLKLAEAFKLARSDCEENGKIGTMAWRVRFLTKMAEDVTNPATSRLEAIRKLSDLWAYGGMGHRPLAVEQFWRGGDGDGGKSLDESFRRTMKFQA